MNELAEFPLQRLGPGQVSPLQPRSPGSTDEATTGGVKKPLAESQG